MLIYNISRNRDAYILKQIPGSFILYMYILSKKRVFALAPAILLAGILLFSAGCSNTKYYNRYNKEKPCKMQDPGAKKARKYK